MRPLRRFPAGASLWSFYEFPGNTEEDPDVGPDNVAYTVRNLSTLFALNPDGSFRWRYIDPGILFEPVVSPTNSLVFMGGRVTYGQPGFFLAVGTGGVPLWRIDLPDEPDFEPYGQLVPISRPFSHPMRRRPTLWSTWPATAVRRTRTRSCTRSTRRGVARGTGCHDGGAGSLAGGLGWSRRGQHSQATPDRPCCRAAVRCMRVNAYLATLTCLVDRRHRREWQVLNDARRRRRTCSPCSATSGLDRVPAPVQDVRQRFGLDP